jgi:cell division initiation protein
MKITPLEIRQKSFERTMRGYDKDEVTAFLVTLSQEWERLIDETKELRIKYEASEREVSKLREVESSLYKTLKTAEDTGANLIDQAQKTAELHLRESQLRADSLLNEAKERAKNTMDEAEQSAKEIIEDMEGRLIDLVQDYKNLDMQRTNLLADLKRISGEALDRAERMKKTDDFNPEQYLNRARKELKKIVYPNQEPAKPVEPPKVEAPVQEPIVVEAPVAPVISQTKEEEPEAVKPEPKPATARSFFDDIA